MCLRSSRPFHTGEGKFKSTEGCHEIDKNERKEGNVLHSSTGGINPGNCGADLHAPDDTGHVCTGPFQWHRLARCYGHGESCGTREQDERAQGFTWGVLRNKRTGRKSTGFQETTIAAVIPDADHDKKEYVDRHDEKDLLGK
jgi:hypothetical protein